MLVGFDITVREEIGKRNDEFMACFANGDARGIAQLYTEDGQLLPPNMEMMEGREAITQLWQGAMDAGVASLKMEITEVDGNEKIVYEMSRYQMLSADGQVIDSGKYIVIWKRVGDEWFLYRDIWNSSMPVA